MGLIACPIWSDAKTGQRFSKMIFHIEWAGIARNSDSMVSTKKSGFYSEFSGSSESVTVL